MSQRLKILTVAFIGLHVPLVLVMIAALLLQLPQAGLIIGLVFGATLIAVVATLAVLWVLLAQDQRPAPQPALRG